MTAQIARGLEGVVSHATELSDVDGAAGRLVIRGYDVDLLAGSVSFEEAAYLLWYGALPNKAQLAELRAAMAEARRLPPALLDWARRAGEMPGSMHALRSAATAVNLDDPEPDDNSRSACLRRAIRITARLPLLVAAVHRSARGLPPNIPPAEVSVAAGYLFALDGDMPSVARVAALDAYLVALIEHGMNASTFTARVIASTGSDMVSALTGAIGALKGPLHGGVPGPVLDMLEEIGTPARAEAWVRAALGRGERIMGFGHRVYRVRDPRVAVLERAVERLATAPDVRRLLELAREVERVTVQILAETKPGRDLYANVELAAALILHAVGVPAPLFTPTFAIARCAGWMAHVLEQYGDNRLIRPQSVYLGPRDRPFVDLLAR